MCALVTGVQTCALPILEPLDAPAPSENLVGSLIGFLWTTGWFIGTVIAEASLHEKAQKYNWLVEYDDDIYPQELNLSKYTWGQIGRAYGRERVCQYV